MLDLRPAFFFDLGITKNFILNFLTHAQAELRNGLLNLF